VRRRWRFTFFIYITFDMKSIRLKPGREKALLRRHPWIFSGAIAEVMGDPVSGETLDVIDVHGNFLARGAYSPESQIRVRVWTFDEAERVDADFFRKRLKTAISFRGDKRWMTGGRSELALPTSVRLVHAESDGIPGLVVDRYGDALVIQVLTAGAEAWRDSLADLLMELTECRNIYERSDAEVRKLEGLPLRIGTMRGAELDGQLQIEENDLKYRVDLQGGHKTGFYLDQRLNRMRVRELAVGRDVLDCFSYSGGFALNALAGSASSVTAVDSSAEALHMLADNLALNGLPNNKQEAIEGDVFKVLRTFRDSRRDFGMIILDPPKFAHNRSQAQKAARGYKDINLLAFKLLRPGGILVTFSCSGGISAEFFQQIVAGAALDAGVDAQIIERLSQSPDHPVTLQFPEGDYLKGLVIHVSD
jgi:23S rRNA (cytosine1962-C5)-methyltransferase